MSTEFPAFLKLEYQASNASQTFLADMSNITGQGKRLFAEFGQEAARQVDTALAAARRTGGSLDLGVKDLREAARLARDRAVAAREIAVATEAAARAEGAYSSAARQAVAATQAIAKENEAAARAAMSHAEAAAQVQAQLDQAASRTRQITGEFLALAQAEAGAANGAAMLAAVYRGTSAEIGRAGNSARESAKAFELLFQAQDARTSNAAQNFHNAALGIDAQTKSARDSARAFEEMFAAQEKAAAAQRGLEAAASALRAELDPMFAAQQRFDVELERADKLLKAGTISTREYAAAQQLARNNLREAAQAATASGAAIDKVQKVGTNATQSVINSTRSERQAFVMLGQQMTDVTVQAQMGTRAITIFTQQVPQAAFALSGLARSADTTKRRIGEFATFMSGPWGAAIFAAIAVLGPLTYALLQSGDAADDTTKSHRSLTDVLDDSRSSYEDLREALKAYNDEQDRSRFVTLASLQIQLQKIQANYDEAISSAQAILPGLARSRQLLQEPGADITGGGAGIREAQLDKQLDAANALIRDFRASRLNAINEVATSAAGIATDPQAAIKDRFNTLREQARNTIPDLDRLTARYAELNRMEQAATNDLRTQSGPRSGRAGRVGREVEMLVRFGDRAAENIQRINERFSEQPRLITQADRATRELDRIMAELAERQPPGFQQMIADAQEAQSVIQDALVRPFAELEQQSERRLEIERLITAGRDDEAEALQIIWSLERDITTLNEKQRADILDMVRYEREVTDELQRRRDLQDAYLDANRQLRGELESFFAGEGADFEKIARRLQSRVFVEQMFGDALRELDEVAKSGLDRSIDLFKIETERASDASAKMADALGIAAERIRNPDYDQFQRDFDAVMSGNAAANDNTPIMVGADRPNRNTIGGMTPEAYFTIAGKRLVAPLLEGLDDAIGVKLSGQLENILGGALGGYLAGGPVTGILGGLKEIPGLSDGLKDIFGQAFEGAMQGQQWDSVMKSLGLNSSKTGAQLGGAIGSFLPIPGGQIIGSIAGGLLGGLFKSTPKASATVGGSGVLGVTGKKKLIGAAGDLGDSVFDSIEEIADALNATINSSMGRVSIGIRKDDIMVDPTGRGETKASRGAINFGQDQQAAIAFAVRDLISDGVLAGLSAAEQRLLKAQNDIDKAVRDVLDFRSVFKRLREYKDPVGAALAELDEEFNDLINLFKRAGASAAEFAQLEELYGIERAQAIEEASQRLTSALQDLIRDLTIGDSGLSLRDRRSNALTEYDALAARVRAGDTTAYDDFAQAARALLDIERQIFGSQSEYFARLDEVTSLSQSAVDAQQQLIDAAVNRDSPFGAGSEGNAALISSIDNGNQQIVGAILTMNGNLVNVGQMLEMQYAVNNKGAQLAAFGDSF